eukprot:407506_1
MIYPHRITHHWTITLIAILIHSKPSINSLKSSNQRIKHTTAHTFIQRTHSTSKYGYYMRDHTSSHTKPNIGTPNPVPSSDRGSNSSLSSIRSSLPPALASYSVHSTSNGPNTTYYATK